MKLLIRKMLMIPFDKLQRQQHRICKELVLGIHLIPTNDSYTATRLASTQFFSSHSPAERKMIKAVAFPEGSPGPGVWEPAPPRNLQANDMLRISHYSLLLPNSFSHSTLSLSLISQTRTSASSSSSSCLCPRPNCI